MHNAPSVSYPVGRCAFQRGLYLFLMGVTSAVLAAWAFHQGFTWLWFVAVLLVLLGGVAGALATRFVATLTWGGQDWCLHDQSGGLADAIGDVAVILDNQKTLLLRWQPTSDTLPTSSHWLWLDAERSGPHWQALRCAVYQRTELN
jgi:hypothetical protein